MKQPHNIPDELPFILGREDVVSLLVGSKLIPMNYLTMQHSDALEMLLFKVSEWIVTPKPTTPFRD